MRYLSEKITDYIIKSGAISGESYEIYQYGFQIGLEMGSCFLVSLGIALYLHIRNFSYLLVFLCCCVLMLVDCI